MIKKFGCCTTKSNDVSSANIGQILANKLVSNWTAAFRLLHYVLDMPKISEQLIINQLLQTVKIFQCQVILNQNEPIKVVHLQNKLTTQHSIMQHDTNYENKKNVVRFGKARNILIKNPYGR